MALSREEIELIASRTADEVVSQVREETELRDFIIGSMMDGGAIPIGGREKKKLPCRGCRIDPNKPLEVNNVMATTKGAIGMLSAQEVRDWCSELIEVPDGRCQRVRQIREPLRRPVTAERLEEVVGLRRMGYTLERIGGMLGYTRSHILYLLHQAGELVDPRPEADRLNNRLHAISRRLSPPASIQKLTVAALEAKEVADEVPLLWEIVPGMDLTTRFLLQDIHSRALRAAEVLRNGVWCLGASEMEELPLPPPEYEVPGRPTGRPRPIPVIGALKTHLIACGEWAIYVARGIIEGWPEYQEPWEVLLEPVPEEAESLVAS